MTLLEPCERGLFGVLIEALVILPPFFSLTCLIEFRELLTMNTNSDSAIFLGQVLNHLIFSFLVNVCLDATSDALGLIGLSQEAAFAFLKTCLGIGDVTDLCFVLVELLKHLFFARLFEKGLRRCRRTVYEV